MTMKPTLLTLLTGLLAALPAPARDFRPLRITHKNNGTVYRPNCEPVGRVVLVHGFLETGSSMMPLRKRLQKNGFECLVPRLKPNDGRGGLETAAEGLKRDIESAFGPTGRISIVAFSMGGLVSRHYLQHLGGAERCSDLITISSPHHGTHAACLYPTIGAEQMRPGSRFLRGLADSEEALGNMAVVSYRTPMDLIILPPASSAWRMAENLQFPVLMHPLMLNSRAVLDDIEMRLLKSHRG